MVNRLDDRRVVVERDINASAERIFDVLADPRRHPVIDGSGAVLDPTIAAPRRLSQGATFRMRMRSHPASADPAHLLQAGIALASRGRLKITVVEFAEPRRIAWRNFGGHIWRYELEPITEESTRVREIFDYATNRTPWLLELVGFPTKNKASMTRTLERLDALVTAE